MKMTTEMMNWLREIVSHEPYNEDDLAAWSNEFLAAHYDGDDDFWERIDEERRYLEQQVPQLKRQVAPYHHDLALPALPRIPHGQLHGIGFIYDEDRDDRVLVAIEKLKINPGIVALAEHEGKLTIYSRLPVGETSLNVCCDEWVIDEFVPYQGRWVEVTPKFVKDCIVQVLGQQPVAAMVKE